MVNYWRCDSRSGSDIVDDKTACAQNKNPKEEKKKKSDGHLTQSWAHSTHRPQNCFFFFFFFCWIRPQNCWQSKIYLMMIRILVSNHPKIMDSMLKDVLGSVMICKSVVFKYISDKSIFVKSVTIVAKRGYVNLFTSNPNYGDVLIY